MMSQYQPEAFCGRAKIRFGGETQYGEPRGARGLIFWHLLQAGGGGGLKRDDPPSTCIINAVTYYSPPFIFSGASSSSDPAEAVFLIFKFNSGR